MLCGVCCIFVCVCSQVNRVAIWQYDPSSMAGSPPSSQEGYVEPACECEVGVSGDVMDMQWLDEERVVVGLSTGSVVLLHFRRAQKVLYTVRIYI